MTKKSLSLEDFDLSNLQFVSEIRGETTYVGRIPARTDLPFLKSDDPSIGWEWVGEWVDGSRKIKRVGASQV